MRRIKLAWIPAVLLFAGMAFGQISPYNHFPFKDLIFPQVAAGGEYQTWITVTNRGTVIWNGTLKFYRGAGVPWSPVVDAVPLAGGTLAISISPGATTTYKVTLPSSTEAGYVMVQADDLDLTNFLEGNLTYYISSGGPITDSVGVPPSMPFVASSLPFEDFNAIALALVNADFEGRAASVKLKLFSDANVPQGPTKSLPLGNMEHTAQYLWQLFPGISLGRGRLEIESYVPISGIALTQVAGGQLSSLPLGSTTRTYSITTTSAEVSFARMTLWTEGFFVNGYFAATINGSTRLFAVMGQIINGELHLHFDGDNIDPAGYEMFGYIKTDGTFTPGQTPVTGTYYTTIAAESYIDSGSFVATLIP